MHPPRHPTRVRAARDPRGDALGSPGQRLLLAGLLALGVVLWEHVIHALILGGHSTLGGHAAHVLRDSALSLPLALTAVLATAAAVSRWRARAGGQPPPVAAVAALLSVVYALLMVPSVVVHSLIDGRAIGMVVEAHASATGGLEHATTLPGMALHGLRDALVAEVAALPLALMGLALLAARQRAGRAPQARRARLAVALATVTAATTVLPGSAALAQPEAGTSSGGNPCDTAPKRTYNVSAINVDITYNRFGDHDPFGFMYVLDGRISAVRAQESTRQVSTGLRQDPIQPLVLRARMGECLVINFTNRLTAPPRGGPNDANLIEQPGGVPAVSLSPQGVAYEIGSQGNAVGHNPNSMVAPGQSRTYRFYIDPALGEGAKVFHSGGEARQLTAHGLFGAIIAEPPGSRWLDPETGQDRTSDPNWSNWEAIIQTTSSSLPAFREFAIMYHDVGDENFNLRQPPTSTNPLGPNVPMIDLGLSGAYRPTGKAINYRAESFWRRLQLFNDKSLAYGSYAFGDPATPIPRSYLGEPTKTRLMHPGSEQLHVHHLHGGGDRWRANPDADNTLINAGLQKFPDKDRTPRSIRLDSQSVGPDEAYNLEHECGAGGCQQAAGDFLYHCHIAHHYIGGMWGFWRVFDTRQPDLAVLPGRPAPPTAVNSVGLIGKVIEGKTVVPAAQLTDPSRQRSLEELVESQLPPQGVPSGPDDATVWNWVKEGTPTAPLYKGEPETTAVWPNYASPTPGERPEILFNPTNGRYAWPLLRPHLGQRPPFTANGHTGTPWLGDTTSATRPDGLCPASAPVKTYNITAISVPIRTTKTEVDNEGMIYVLNEDKDAVLSGAKPPEPLAIRSNVGDCVALTLSSELNPTQQPKVNIHTHFVQFDPQGSDGIVTGLSFEQGIKPASTENRTLAAGAAAGATTVSVSGTTGLRAGVSVAVGIGRPNIEIRTVRALTDTTITLDKPLQKAHAAGEPVGVEFVQLRWYSDVDSGTVFWHDHVEGIKSWGHGLFGAHIIEPPGSTYHDPRTGAPVRSGSIVDIHTSGSVGAGHSGSFREFMIWLHNGREGNPQDDPLNIGQECEEGSINLRAEPFEVRVPTELQTREPGGPQCDNVEGRVTPPGDPNAFSTVGTTDPYVFSSVKYGDPFTPIPRAYVGDPFVIRTIGLVERVGALRVQGHRFRRERFHGQSELMDAATTGISERFDYILEGGAGGPKRMAGDYLYYSTRNFELEGGAWGILRVHDKLQPDLKPLPGRTPPSGTGFPRLAHTGQAPPPPDSTNATNPDPCPSTAPVRRYDVSIFNMPLPTTQLRVGATSDATGLTQDPDGIVYALAADRPAIQAGQKPLEPLVIRANAGDCVEVRLTNDIAAGTARGGERASFSLAKLISDPLRSGGSAVGYNPDTTVARGRSYTYRFYADRELGASIFQNLGSTSSLLHGAYGVLVVEAAGSTYHSNTTNEPISSGTIAIIRHPFKPAFREYVLTYLTTDDQNGRSVVEYEDDVEGWNHINYRNEPFVSRFADNPDRSLVFSSAVHGDPATPILRAYAGDPVRFRVAVPASQQFHTFTLDGHVYPWDPYMPAGESHLLTSRAVGPGETQEAIPVGGAGGTMAEPGDYMYRDGRLPWTRAGMWGIFRVYPAPFKFFSSSSSGVLPDLAPL